MSGKDNHSMDRRSFMRKTSAGVCAAALAPNAVYGYAKKSFTVRVLGTHVTLQEELRQRAEKELGIKLVFEPGGSAAVLHKASTRPQSFDLYEQWSNSLNVLWQAQAIQPIDVERIRNWSEVNDLTKVGKVTPRAKLGLGDAPYKLLYAQDDGSRRCPTFS